MGFTPNAIERTKRDELSMRSEDRTEADGAAPSTDSASTSDLVSPAPSDAPLRTAEAEQEAAGRDMPPITKAERNMQRLTEKVAGPLRTYIEEGPLRDEDKKALVEALTQFDADVGQLSETVDVERLNEEMRAAFERFYTSLVRIFGSHSDQGAEATGRTVGHTAPRPAVDQTESPPSGAVGSNNGERRLPPSNPFPPNPSLLGEDQRPAGEAMRPPVEAPLQVERERGAIDEAYQRIASMYTALYGLSSDPPSSLNEQG
jgi:hypothetical protein